MWGLAVSVYLTAVFHRSGLAVASITAERRFHIGPSVLATLVAVQLGVYALMQIPSGAMTDRFGSRRMLAAAVVFMGAGEIVFALATNAGVALVGRGLVGLGDAVTFLSVLRLVQNWFPVTHYGLLAAITGLVGYIGQLVSTVPLHASLVHLGWTTTFAASGAVTLAVGVPMVAWVRNRPESSPADGRASAPTARPNMAHAVRQVMSRRSTWNGMWAHLSLTGPFVLFTALWGYPFLVRAEHYSAARASEALALVVLAAVAGAPLVGLLLVRAPQHRAALVFTSGSLLLATWVVVLALGPGHDPGWLLFCLLVATGFGGPASVAAFDLARQANPPEQGGAATGVVNIGGFAGAVVADLLIGLLLDTVGHGGHSPAAFRGAMTVVPVMIAAGLIAFWLSGSRAAPATPRAPAGLSSRPESSPPRWRRRVTPPPTDGCQAPPSSGRSAAPRPPARWRR